VTYTLWAKHEKVKWAVPLFTGLSGAEAVAEMLRRQDRVRRSGQPCRFKVVPDGVEP
jgi:hypothetical protein